MYESHRFCVTGSTMLTSEYRFLVEGFGFFALRSRRTCAWSCDSALNGFCGRHTHNSSLNFGTVLSLISILFLGVSGKELRTRHRRQGRIKLTRKQRCIALGFGCLCQYCNINLVPYGLAHKSLSQLWGSSNYMYLVSLVCSRKTSSRFCGAT